MRFLIDECLHESLAGVAHAEGYEAAHVNHLGLSGATDRVVLDRALAGDYTLATNNRMDFLRLVGAVELHAGLIVIVPNAPPGMQRAMFGCALQFLRGVEAVNAVIEVTLHGDAIDCVRYEWPKP